jgi:hypothetical protein
MITKGLDGIKTVLSAYVVHGDVLEISIRNEVDTNTSLTVKIYLDRSGAEMLHSELSEYLKRVK